MKTQEQRIDDAAEVLRDRFGLRASHDVARRVLEAADREPSVWPTDESMAAAFPGPMGKQVRQTVHAQLRDAFLADPIIKVAIAYRDGHGTDSASLSLCGRLGRAVIDAVKEAGL